MTEELKDWYYLIAINADREEADRIGAKLEPIFQSAKRKRLYRADYDKDDLINTLKRLK